MATERQSRRVQEVLEAPHSPERPLNGKKAIVTGGSRDIGASIVRNLALSGVNVVFMYKRDDESANEVLEFVAQTPSQAHAVKADLEKSEDRQAFVNEAIEILGGNVDFLILSASGRSRTINQEASNDLIDKMLSRINEGGTVLRMTSAIAHFGRQFEDDPSIPKVYHKPAEAKNEEEKSLRERIEELKAKKIRLIMVAPPAVPSRNLDLVNELTLRATGRARSAEDIHNVISDNLGLPRTLSQSKVGEKIIELLSNPDIESGYTELFSGVLDVQTQLGRLYDTPQVYVNTLQALEELDGQNRGVGRAIISVKQASQGNDQPMIDESWIDLPGECISKVRIVPDHARGHFKKESGLPQILPGHEQIHMAVEAIEVAEKAFGKSDNGIILTGFESAEFLSIVIANGKTELLIIPTQKSDGTYDVEILRESNRERTAIIEGIRVRSVTESDKDTLLGNQIIEGVAQTIGAVGVKDLAGNMPLLLSIGKVEFIDGGVKAGHGIDYSVVVEKSGKRGVEGSALVYSEGRMIAEVHSIKATLVNKDVASRLLR